MELSNTHLSTPNSSSIGILILAAGASRRMGTPKQLLLLHNQTLLERAINTATQLDPTEIMAVLGANERLIRQSLKTPSNISIAVNKSWDLGMGTTLQLGTQRLLEKNAALAAILVMVCDQPFLTVSVLTQLIHTFEQSKNSIVAAKYDNEAIGVPALFPKFVFPKLLELKGDIGARKILKQYQSNLKTIDFPKGSFDIDTPERYQALLDMWDREKI